MCRIIAAADIHGSYQAWSRVKALLKDDDILAVAGDLFGNYFTRYSAAGKSDYRPKLIKEEFIDLINRKYYVYGNCDDIKFFAGQKDFLKFNFCGLNIFMEHGDRNYRIYDKTDIVIYGHIHKKRLEKIGDTIFLNPGSAAFPRDDRTGSCAIIEKDKIKIVALTVGIKKICELNL